VTGRRSNQLSYTRKSSEVALLREHPSAVNYLSHSGARNLPLWSYFGRTSVAAEYGSSLKYQLSLFFVMPITSLFLLISNGSKKPEFPRNVTCI